MTEIESRDRFPLSHAKWLRERKTPPVARRGLVCGKIAGSLRCRLILNHSHCNQLVPHLIQGALDGAEMRTECICATREFL
jgi:hypothetical protein